MFLLLFPLFFLCFSDLDKQICIKDRDPFYVSSKSSSGVARYFKREPKVVGIIKFNGVYSASISFGNSVEVVGVGDLVNGYVIMVINNNDVLALTPEKEEVRWFM